MCTLGLVVMFPVDTRSPQGSFLALAASIAFATGSTAISGVQRSFCEVVR
jgi:hypothetical protein